MIRVLVVDDDPMVRLLLRTILRPDDIEVVAEAGDGDEAVTQTQAHHPDVVLMDLRMPRVDGIRATELLRALPTPPGVIAMTSFDTESVILDAVRAGADGFLAKDSSPDQIVAAVRDVAAGEGALSPRAARTVMEQVSTDRAAAASRDAQERLRVLTERENDVALAVAAGRSNGEIARELFVSEATVKTHLARAMEKLGVAGRVQVAMLVALAGSAVPDHG
ncbi:response regulator transcription factor [Cellulomonas sp. zg-ZUI199]|uniref:Response regulator transcription factor n=1 Tax=Cellulomonas wangleii TaxID=2816956 RepID=A0ABX8D7N7_9CELL|nr:MULTISPECIES: response regulator transcription factor [Cellulomonas]MBO0898949.1 response regulator transcription factor [Cellulomonas sp. zg-ZUI22]MBO0923764.1 response regulator transcription factor [Cellulomonas wangleii]MBO0924046.1 response regulator transcription factor [Cellulomonas wangleii]QVI62072.1 response regulator transcription factor [Cellulomonas wangleii]